MTTEPLDITVPTITVPTDLGERVVSQYTVQQLAHEVATLRAELRMVKADLTKVCEAIYAEACSRDWCGDYDTFVERVNGETSTQPLAVRMEEQEFTITVSISRPRATGTVTDKQVEQAVLDAMVFDGTEDVTVSVRPCQ